MRGTQKLADCEFMKNEWIGWLSEVVGVMWGWRWKKMAEGGAREVDGRWLFEF